MTRKILYMSRHREAIFHGNHAKGADLSVLSRIYMPNEVQVKNTVE